MRRLATLLVLLAVTSGARAQNVVINAVSPYLDPTKPLTASRVDVTRYGVLPGFDFSKAASNSRILDQLVAQVVTEVGTTQTTTAKTLYCPGTPASGYWLTQPIISDQSGVYLEGDGPDVSVTRLGGTTAIPTAIFGLRRNPERAHAHGPANFVPNALTGAPASNGQSYGLATLATTTLIGSGTAAALGPLSGGWPSVRQLTISVSAHFDFKPYNLQRTSLQDSQSKEPHSPG